MNAQRGNPGVAAVNAQRCSDAGVVAAGLLALLAWDASGGDLAAVRMFGNAHGFAWREHWFFSQLLHSGGRWLALAVLAGLALNVLWPAALARLAGRPAGGAPLLSSKERWWWLLSTLACALLVPALKQLSLTSCPWELAEFGGVAQHVSHWRLGLPDGGPGHCFPSGHATSAFALLSAWFVLRGPRPRLARAWLAAVLLAGLLFGVGQLVRGAHYPSHTLWTAWLCWTLCAAAALALPSRQGA